MFYEIGRVIESIRDDVEFKFKVNRNKSMEDIIYNWLDRIESTVRMAESQVFEALGKKSE